MGMSTLFRMSTPAWTSGPPIQLASTGLPSILAYGFSCSAVIVGSVISCGVRITSMPSVFGSLAAISSALAYLSGPASPRISIGLLRLQWGGSKLFNALNVSLLISASCPPSVIKASVARTPGPPAFVTMVSLCPRGRGCLPRTSAMSKSSLIESTRSTPVRRKAASSTASLPVRAPV